MHQKALARQVTDGPYALNLNATVDREYCPQGGDMINTGEVHTSAEPRAGPETNKTNLHAKYLNLYATTSLGMLG